jgi:hypothetical protein
MNLLTNKKAQQRANISTKGSDDFPLSIGSNCLHLFILTYKQLDVFEYFNEKFIFPLNFVSVSSPNFKNLKNSIQKNQTKKIKNPAIYFNSIQIKLKQTLLPLVFFLNQHQNNLFH